MLLFGPVDQSICPPSFLTVAALSHEKQKWGLSRLYAVQADDRACMVQVSHKYSRAWAVCVCNAVQETMWCFQRMSAQKLRWLLRRNSDLEQWSVVCWCLLWWRGWFLLLVLMRKKWWFCFHVMNRKRWLENVILWHNKSEMCGNEPLLFYSRSINRSFKALAWWIPNAYLHALVWHNRRGAAAKFAVFQPTDEVVLPLDVLEPSIKEHINWMLQSATWVILTLYLTSEI